jgi:hypothetical protein
MKVSLLSRALQNASIGRCSVYVLLLTNRVRQIPLDQLYQESIKCPAAISAGHNPGLLIPDFPFPKCSFFISCPPHHLSTSINDWLLDFRCLIRLVQLRRHLQPWALDLRYSIHRYLRGLSLYQSHRWKLSLFPVHEQLNVSIDQLIPDHPSLLTMIRSTLERFAWS